LRTRLSAPLRPLQSSGHVHQVGTEDGCLDEATAAWWPTIISSRPHPDPEGASIELSASIEFTGIDNDETVAFLESENFCVPEVSYGDGDFGTPGSAPSCF
jgi:hypothetical protein